MNGSNRCIYKTFDFANIIAEGCTVEEGVEWTVIRNIIDNEKVYSVCRVSEYDYDTKAEGWVIADD
jgi:hypothetical protein